MNQLVGVLELSSKYRYGLTSRGTPMYLFKPYSAGQPYSATSATDYIVGSSERDLSRNKIALVECLPPTTTTEKPRGTLLRLFGPVGDPIAEQAALLQHYCPHRQTTTAEMLDSEDENRQPLDAANGWRTFHIDPPGCRDIDDAIAYHPETRTLAITIADAAAAVPADSPTDKVAAAIGATFYDLNGRVVRPMLPPTISEETASLLPGQRRRGVTLFLEADGTERFGLTWITVTYSFTYACFGGTSIAYDLQVSQDSHTWIEELMIRYNRAVAAVLKKAGAGLLRTQAPTDAEKLAKWADIDPALAAEAALYEPATPDKEQTHASLGVYCHASSPLRRYADLVNQRALKAILNREEPPPTISADHLNDRAKANKRWGRDLMFLRHVIPGKIHEIDVVWASATHVWVPLCKRLIRLRHEEERPVGTKGRIQIFCDMTKRDWRQRILTNSLG